MGDEKYLIAKDEGQPLIILSADEKEMLGLIFKAAKDVQENEDDPYYAAKLWILFSSLTVRGLAKRMNWEIPL